MSATRSARTSTVTLRVTIHTVAQRLLQTCGSCVFGVAQHGVSLSSALSVRPASVDGAGTHLHAFFFSGASVVVQVEVDGVGDALSLTDADGGARQARFLRNVCFYTDGHTASNAPDLF